jgi:peptidyl-prolyl cis-trans isomerase C
MAQASARHILVDSEEKCKALKTEIENGADFAQVARENSSCPSSRDGGNLGTFGRGQMVREFDEVVFSAPVGVVQGPVKTQFGSHLVEVTARQD